VFVQRAKVRKLEQDAAEMGTQNRKLADDCNQAKAEAKQLKIELNQAQVSVTALSARVDAITMQARAKVSTLHGEAGDSWRRFFWGGGAR
jgi:chromosome segregation ATPase